MYGMKQINAVVDRQATSLLDISFWSNIVVITLIAAINAVNLIRAGTGHDPLVGAITPGLVLVVSLALIAWMGIGCIEFKTIKHRLGKVRVMLDDIGISGYTLANPTMREEGERFSISYADVCYAGIVDVPISKKHSVPSLKIATAERAYVIPAPENLREIERIISERMPKA
jgi:hypothetical protein